MVKRTVKWTRTADIQYVGVLEYWVKRNKSNRYSKKLIQEITKLTNQIVANPLAFKSVGFNDNRLAQLRHYSVIYQITDREIIVTAFWDNRQDPKKLVEILRSK